MFKNKIEILFITGFNLSFKGNTQNISYNPIDILKKTITSKVTNFKSSFSIKLYTHTLISIIISENTFNKSIFSYTILYSFHRNTQVLTYNSFLANLRLNILFSKTTSIRISSHVKIIRRANLITEASPIMNTTISKTTIAVV